MKVSPRARDADVMIARGVFLAVRHEDVARLVLTERDTGAQLFETIDVFSGYFRQRGDKFFRFHKIPSFPRENREEYTFFSYQYTPFAPKCQVFGNFLKKLAPFVEIFFFSVYNRIRNSIGSVRAFAFKAKNSFRAEREAFMTIDDLKKEKIAAMKSRDADAVSAYNAMISKLTLASIEAKGAGREFGGAEFAAVLKKVQKELTEEKESFAAAGRSDSVASLERQLAVIEKYLPKMLSEAQIKEIILALPDKSVPAVMKHFKGAYAGKCDMKLVGEILKTL